MPVVVDASALVELLLQSERAPAVLQAVGNTEMVAPDGINPEVLSTLRRLERIGELPAGRAIQAVDDLLDAWQTEYRPEVGGHRLIGHQWSRRASLIPTIAALISEYAVSRIRRAIG